MLDNTSSDNNQKKLFSRLRALTSSKVRYRLIFLTSIPICITMLGLVAITLYWSVTYTWKNTLNDVAERISFAHEIVDMDNQLLAAHITSLGDSARFHYLLQHSSDTGAFNVWLANRAKGLGLSYIRWVPAAQQQQLKPLTSYPATQAFFTLLQPEQLARVNPALAQQSSILTADDKQSENPVLVRRFTYPIVVNNTQLGYLDAVQVISNNADYVDRLKALIYPVDSERDSQDGVVTLFMQDLRVTTNVLTSASEPSRRAVGTYAAENVVQKVLGEGREYIDIAWVYDQWYVSGYRPLVNPKGERIGMLFTGYELWPIVYGYMFNLGEIIIMVLVVLIITSAAVYRVARRLFLPIEQMATVVALVKQGDESRRIGPLMQQPQDELSTLATQFDAMLDKLELRKQHIQSDAELLEQKVAERTAKLKEKKEQLERHNQLLNDTRDRLLASEKLAAIGKLTAGIAHEINNPTAVILGNIELIRDDLREGNLNVDNEFTIILNQIDRIRSITHSLLQYSREDNAIVNLTRQNIGDIITESVTLVKTATKRSNVMFNLELESSTQVELNKNHFLQVLVNLEINAISALNDSGTITITASDKLLDDQVVGVIVQVKDTGSGIAEEHLSRIFDPFFTTKPDGTGLGLSVSQSLLSQIGASISVWSQMGQGTVFTIELPIPTLPGIYPA